MKHFPDLSRALGVGLVAASLAGSAAADVVALRGPALVRSSPSVEADVVAVVPDEGTVDVTPGEPGSPWFRVTTSEGSGFMAGSLDGATFVFDEVRAGGPGPLGDVIALHAEAVLRTGPAPGRPEAAMLPAGSTVQLVERYAGWGRVEAEDGQAGWVDLSRSLAARVSGAPVAHVAPAPLAQPAVPSDPEPPSPGTAAADDPPPSTDGLTAAERRKLAVDARQRRQDEKKASRAAGRAAREERRAEAATAPAVAEEPASTEPATVAPVEDRRRQAVEEREQRLTDKAQQRTDKKLAKKERKAEKKADKKANKAERREDKKARKAGLIPEDDGRLTVAGKSSAATAGARSSVSQTSPAWDTSSWTAGSGSSSTGDEGGRWRSSGVSNRELGADDSTERRQWAEANPSGFGSEPAPGGAERWRGSGPEQDWSSGWSRIATEGGFGSVRRQIGEEPLIYRNERGEEVPTNVISEVVARINDEVVTNSQFEQRMREHLRDLRVSDPERAGALSSDELRRVTLSRLVEERLLMSQARTLGYDLNVIYEAAKDEYMQQRQFENDLDLLRELDSFGLSWTEFQYILLRRRVPRMLLAREVLQKIAVPENEAVSYYDENIEEWEHAECVRLREVVLQPEARESSREFSRRLEEVLTRLDGGSDFCDVVQRYSRSPSREECGILRECFTFDMLDEKAASLAFRMRPGDVEPIRTEWGYHVLLLEEMRPRRTDPFAEVRDQVIDRLRRDRLKGAVDEYIATLRRDADIEISARYDNYYQPAEDTLAFGDAWQ